MTTEGKDKTPRRNADETDVGGTEFLPAAGGRAAGVFEPLGAVDFNTPCEHHDHDFGEG